MCQVRHTPTGTQCNIVKEPTAEDAELKVEKSTEPESHEDEEPAPTHEYETDEDEFLREPDTSTVACLAKPALDTEKRPVKPKNTAKRRKSAQLGYDLAYFNLWWARMAVEGRREAKELRKVEEEERLAKRKRKWVEFGPSMAKKRTSDTTRMNDILSSPIQYNIDNQSSEITQGGSDDNGGNMIEGGNSVGVRQPDVICEQSLSFTHTRENLKYGTSENFVSRSMGPGPDDANLVMGKDGYFEEKGK